MKADPRKQDFHFSTRQTDMEVESHVRNKGQSLMTRETLRQEDAAALHLCAPSNASVTLLKPSCQNCRGNQAKPPLWWVSTFPVSDTDKT